MNPAASSLILVVLGSLLLAAAIVYGVHRFMADAAKNVVVASPRTRPSDLPIGSPERERQLMAHSAVRDTLICLIENGPLWDGNVPSKSGRDALIEAGLAVRCVQRANDGYTAATYRGRDAYNRLFGGSTIAESLAHRIAHRINSKEASK